MYRFLGSALLFLAVCLVACSESSITDDFVDRNDMGVVSTVDDLPPCTADNDGEPFFVKSEKIIRVCSDAKWYAVREEESSENGSSAGNGGSEVRSSSSGYDRSCYVSRRSADSLWVVCGSYSFSVPTSGANNSSSVVLDSEKIATSLEGVSGFTQKGPFLMGSEVNVIELRDGRTLEQTGDNFEAKIQSDDGQFKLNARMMMSQYLELHAKGYYRNEVSGKNSNAQLTLYALTDVMMRSGGVVNINLLTHLEYHRVIHLVKEQKMKVAAAKDTAEREIFSLLHIDSKDFFSSEDLNIVGSSEGDAALLAFSVMFQGDRDVSQLSALLTSVSTDMEKDGVWNDTKMRDSIADWAENADATGRLAKIRANVEGWGLSAMVPNFEKYIRSFWTQEYGLPSCDEANVDTLVAASAMRLAESKNRYICVDSAKAGYMWRRATDLEKDTYGWDPGTDGQIKMGDINTSVKYLYDAVLGQWREMTELEEFYGFCNEAVEADSARSVKQNKFDKEVDESYPYVVCKDRQWSGCTAYYADTRKYETEAPDGTVRQGDYTGNTYVFEQNLGMWRMGWDLEGMLKKGCTNSNMGEVIHYVTDYSDEYYSCRRDSFLVDYGWYTGYQFYKPGNGDYIDSEDEHWVETEQRWVLDDYEVAENTYTDGTPCSEGDYKPGMKLTDSYFVCDGGLWRAAKTEEEIASAPCTRNGLSFIYGDSITCEAGEWHATNVFDYSPEEVREKFFITTSVPSGMELGTLHDDRDGRDYQTIKVNINLCRSDLEQMNIEWMAENLNFVGDDYPYLKDHNACYRGDSLNCLKGGRFYTWAAAMNINDKWNKSMARNAGIIDEQHRGVCPEGWHIPSEEEWTRTMYAMKRKATGCPLNDLYGYDQLYFKIIPKQSVFWDGTNEFGFNALYVNGYYDFTEGKSFMTDSPSIAWWSLAESDDFAYHAKIMLVRRGVIESREDDKNHGFPVRCIKNHNLTLY